MIENMLIDFPSGLPAVEELRKEDLSLDSDVLGVGKEDVVRIVILNIMPVKQEAELDFLRLLANYPARYDIKFLHISSHKSKNTSQEHIEKFYVKFSDIKDEFFDGMIITGAPLEFIDFEDVRYWDELKQIMQWGVTNVKSVINVCWAAQAALYHFFGINKQILPAKLFGLFKHEVNIEDSLVKGLQDGFIMPHSRHSEVTQVDCINAEGIEVVASSDMAGVCVLKATKLNQVFVTGHAEYSRQRLDQEYKRDLAKGDDIAKPYGYYRDDNPEKGINYLWLAPACKLYSNWLEYYVCGNAHKN